MYSIGMNEDIPKTKKRPRDPNQLAAQIVSEAIGNVLPNSNNDDSDGKNQAAVALGRLGGKKGGKARAEKLTPEQRKQIAQKAAKSRWNKN